jgi:glycosyltransferase involved in cell wall biosynthesis
LRITHINVTDTKGGAARAAYRLHRGLRRLGYHSQMLVAERSSRDPSVIAFSTSRLDPLLRRLRYRQLTMRYWRYWLTRPKGYDPFTGPSSPSGVTLAEQIPPDEIINLHRIADLLDYPAFFRALHDHTSVVWTQHDMNAFTGGCAYAYDCSGLHKTCGSCPQLGSDNPHDLSNVNWRLKKAIYDRLGANRLHIVTPSHWMATEAQRSSLVSRIRVSVIPNSLDTEVFSPQDRQASRREFAIPHDAHVVLFSAASVVDRRKGFQFLAQALASLDDPYGKLLLVSLGKGRPDIATSVPHLHLGRITDDRHLAQVYSAADLFAIPSLQDNLPNTVLESMACGTPVVGFAVGGIPEMARPGVTGLLASPQDADSLGAVITELLAQPALRAQMRVNCRRVAEHEYALEVQARRYGELYQELAAAARDSRRFASGSVQVDIAADDGGGAL